MKTALLFLFSNFLLALSSDQTTLRIKEGERVDELVLGKSTVANAIEKYGKERKSDYGIIDYVNKAAGHINRFYFSNNVVAVFLTDEGSEKDLKNSIISEIGILYPSDAITDKGISLKSDNLEKIIRIYGLPEEEEKNWRARDLHYYSKGISFSCDDSDGHIQKIAIYEKGQRPRFLLLEY